MLDPSPEPPPTTDPAQPFLPLPCRTLKPRENHKFMPVEFVLPLFQICIPDLLLLDLSLPSCGESSELLRAPDSP